MEYYYYTALKWNKKRTEYKGESYSMIFYISPETDKVTSIRLSHDAVEG